jgi:hypothetical protein
MTHLALKSKTAFVVMAILLSACSALPGTGGGIVEKTSTPLTGAQEVPPVSTSASGRSTITVGADRTVSGSVIVTGMEGMAAHIHQGAAGSNGPVIIPLTKTTATTFTVPAGSRLSDTQYAAYMNSGLYVNVHSAAHPGGEVRMQLKP